MEVAAQTIGGPGAIAACVPGLLIGSIFARIVE